MFFLNFLDSLRAFNMQQVLSSQQLTEYTISNVANQFGYSEECVQNIVDYWVFEQRAEWCMPPGSIFPVFSTQTSGFSSLFYSKTHFKLIKR